MSAYPIAVFTRAKPCTKVEIWRCFHDPDTGVQFMPVPVVYAWTVIGKLVPAHLIAKGHARYYDRAGVDMLELTQEGIAHLLGAVQERIAKHPEDAELFAGLAPRAKHIKRLP